MAGTLLLQNRLIFGSNYFPWFMEDNIYCVPCIIGDGAENPHSERKKFKIRPTGRSGSGPYFVSYKTSGKDYDDYWYNSEPNYHYLTNADVVKTNDYGFECHYFSNGVEAYSCGIGSGPSARKVFWNYIRLVDSKHVIYSAQAPGSYVADSWEGAEELMRKFSSTFRRYNVSYVMTASNCFWKSALPTDNSFNWKLGEFDAFMWHDLTGILPNGYQLAATQSYIAAADAIPEASTNSLANVLQMASSVLDIFHGDISPKHIKDVWLQYRYEYCTTKADIEEYTELTRRLTSLANASTINCSGRFEYQGVSCVTSFDVDSSQWMPESSAAWLKTYGFRFSAVNAWDMVPYSFIVDWFLHISNILEAFQRQGDAISLQTSNCWHVFQTEYEGQFTMFRVPKAIRWGIPYVSYKPASDKTIGKRITDAIALFLC